MPYFGEVREFATGVIYTDSYGLKKMMADQCIWTGTSWATLDSADGIKALKAIAENRSEDHVYDLWPGERSCPELGGIK